MAEYISDMDEAGLIQKLIRDKGDEYYLFNLMSKNSIRTKPVGFNHEVPSIHIIKTGGSEENVLGDTLSPSGKGNFQPSTIMMTIVTRRNISHIYNKTDTNNDLDGVLNDTDLTFTLTGVTNILINDIIQIDDEKMKVSGIDGNDVTVYSRGFLGTIAVTHSDNTDVYKALTYEGIDLCKKIRDVVKQVMFRYHSFYDNSFPDIEFIVENMTSDTETAGIRNYGALFTAELMYSMTFEMRR